MVVGQFHRIAGVWAATLLMAAPAYSQAPIQFREEAPASRDIVVTARQALTEKEIEHLGAAITPGIELFHDSLARFEAPVCPGVVGLPVGIAAAIADRIRYDADRVGATPDTSSACIPNILVIFVRDGAAQIRKMLKDKSFLLAGLPASEGNALRNMRGPVRAWNRTKLRTRFDEVESQSLQQGPVRIFGPSTLGSVPVSMTPASDSHIFLASQLDVVQSVVVIDVSAIDGLSINQIADYAAMRTLAKTRPPRDPAASATILSLFDTSAPHPPEMSRFDLAYLRSLYDGGSNLPAAVKIGGIAREIRKDEAASGGPAR